MTVMHWSEISPAVNFLLCAAGFQIFLSIYVTVYNCRSGTSADHCSGARREGIALTVQSASVRSIIYVPLVVYYVIRANCTIFWDHVL